MNKDLSILVEQKIRLSIFSISLLVNTVFYAVGIRFTWLIFLSNILIFILPGELKERMAAVEIGGFVGITGAYLLLVLITILEPHIGRVLAFVIPMTVVLFLLIVMQPYAPKVFNNAGFAYMCCSCIAPIEFAANIVRVYITYIVGSCLYNIVCLSLVCAVHRRAECEQHEMERQSKFL
jgi:hypothetical protein